MAHAPGRVELLGNHTDYNEGLVLSAAIDRGVTVHGGPRSDGRVVLTSLALDKRVDVPVADFDKQEEESWANYALGVVRVFGNRGYELGGFWVEIVSDLPIGAGLSSSAALRSGDRDVPEKALPVENRFPAIGATLSPGGK